MEPCTWYLILILCDRQVTNHHLTHLSHKSNLSTTPAKENNNITKPHTILLLKAIIKCVTKSVNIYTYQNEPKIIEFDITIQGPYNV